MSHMEIPNGSFEEDVDSDGVPDHWSVFFYPGGTGGYDTGEHARGMKSYKFVHPGGKGNGGGYLESDQVRADPLFFKPVRFACKASAAGMKVACVVLHYDGGKGFLGEKEVYASIANPTAWGLVVITNLTCSFPGTEYVKVRLVGGKDDTDVAGTVWFGAVGEEGSPASVPAAESVDQGEVGARTGGYVDVGTPWDITIPAGGKFSWLVVGIELKGFSWANEMGEGACRPKGRFRIGSRFSSEATGPGTAAWGGPYPACLNIDGLSGSQRAHFQLREEPDAGEKVFLRSPAAARKYFRQNVRVVDAGEGTVADSGQEGLVLP
jgi:hypothetical protein